MMSNFNVSDSAIESKQVDWESFYEETNKKLYYFIRKKVSNIDDAEDILQSTYLEAIKSISNFSSDSRLDTWVFGIALNIIRNHYRKRSGFISIDTMNDSDEESQLYDPGPDMRFEYTDRLKKVFSRLTNIPPDMQDIIILTSFNEYDYHSVSKICHIPIGTVRSRLFRARKLLRKA